MWLVSIALAGGVHSGIPVHGVAGVGEPTFLSPEAGWTAAIDGGFVKVFVGPTEDDAKAWYTTAIRSLTIVPAAATGLGDESFGDGEALFGFRDGNVAVMVRARTDAYGEAAALHEAIVDGVPWPTAPRLVAQGDGTWLVPGQPGFVKFRGGQSVPFKTGVFRKPPEEIVVWDDYGRASVVGR
jgi:hypothetical protein